MHSHQALVDPDKLFALVKLKSVETVGTALRPICASLLFVVTVIWILALSIYSNTSSMEYSLIPRVLSRNSARDS
jgi:hypothetical protein